MTDALPPAEVQEIARRWFEQDPAGWREEGVDGPDDLRKQVRQVLRCIAEAGCDVFPGDDFDDGWHWGTNTGHSILHWVTGEATARQQSSQGEGALVRRRVQPGFAPGPWEPVV